MKKLFAPLLLLITAMFIYAPVAIHRAPYESTMGLVQKIFYFHVPSWFAMFAAMLVRARSRDVLLPILLYPITIPVIIAGVRGTAALLQPEADVAVARMWLSMLVFFDIVFITLALWMFEPAMAE